jgi:putative ABC transport system ATP-binding protein
MVGGEMVVEATLPANAAPAPGSEFAVRLEGVVFCWSDRSSFVLRVEELTVRAGERIFIHGPSGSGKSTLLSLIGGVATPQEGVVSVLGERINRLSGPQRDAFRADHIGFVFQLFNLIPYLPVVDNVTLPCAFSRRRRLQANGAGRSPRGEALRLLDRLSLADEALLMRRATDLSVGQQQRVAVARALIGSPEIVIADEPTSALDLDLRRAFLELLLSECRSRQTTLIFVSHDLTLRALFDRAVPLTEVSGAGFGPH